MKILSLKQGSISVMATLLLATFTAFSMLLFSISKISLDKNRVRLALDRNSELILAAYNEDLYDRFGLLAFEAPEEGNPDLFLSIEDIAHLNDAQIIPYCRLDGDILYSEIERFSRIRFPVHASMSILDFIIDLTETENGIQTQKSKKTPPAESKDKPDEDADTSSGFSCINEVVDLVKGLLVKEEEALEEDEEGGFSKIIGDDLKEAILRSGEGLLEGNLLTKAFGANDSLHGLLGQASEGLSKFYLKESGALYQRLAFEYYCSEMLSCHVNFIKRGEEELAYKNLRGIEIDRYSPSDKHEIERLIFGSHDSDKNFNYTFGSVFALRLAVNIFANYFDEARYADMQLKAGLINLGISLVTMGKFSLPVQLLEAAVILVCSALESYQDWSKLTKGEKVHLIPGFEKKYLEVSYKDYLRIFLLLVPLENKLERIEVIIKEDVSQGRELFFGITSKIGYRGQTYASHRTYFN